MSLTCHEKIGRVGRGCYEDASDLSTTSCACRAREIWRTTQHTDKEAALHRSRSPADQSGKRVALRGCHEKLLPWNLSLTVRAPHIHQISNDKTEVGNTVITTTISTWTGDWWPCSTVLTSDIQIAYTDDTYNDWTQLCSQNSHKLPPTTAIIAVSNN